MPINFDGTDDIRDSTGVVTDAIGTHPGSDGEQFTHGYDYGSITEGLVAYYPMEEGQGQVLHDGALDNLGQISGATWNGSGQVGSDALSFDGTDDYISTTIVNNSGPFTYTAWVNANDFNSNNRVIGEHLSGNVGGNGNHTFLEYRDSGISFFIDDGSTSFFVNAGDTVTDEWVHLVGVFDGDQTLELYKNGVLIGTTTEGSFGTYSPDTSLRIGGQRNDSTLAPFSGVMDDVRVYDRALSEQEILALYERTSPSGVEVKESDVPTQSDSGVSRYEFENDVTDSWGSNDGTDNTSAGFVDGVYGQAKDFDGVDDRVELPDFGFDSSTSFSVSLWLNLDAVEINTTFFGRNDGSDDVLSLQTDTGGSAYRVLIGHVGGEQIDFQVGNPTAGDWKNLQLTYDSGSNEARLYENGVLIGSGSNGSIADFATEDGPWVGARNDNNQFTDGQIDDVRIYSKALSPTEVEQLYNKGAYRIDRGDTL